MTRAPRVCSEPGCPELTTTGRCAAHARQPWAGSRRSSELPANWPIIRRRILRRDGFRCTWTEDGVRCTALATDVDHIRRGGPDTDDNLRSLCRPHHLRKSSQEGHQARKEAR